MSVFENPESTLRSLGGDDLVPLTNVLVGFTQLNATAKPAGKPGYRILNPNPVHRKRVNDQENLFIRIE